MGLRAVVGVAAQAALVAALVHLSTAEPPPATHFELDTPDDVMTYARQVLREEMDRSRQAFVDDGNDAEDWEFDGWGPESPLARRAREAGARRGVMNPSSEDGTSTLVAAPDGEGAMLALPSSEDVGTFAASVNSQQLAASSHGGQLATVSAQVAALTDKMATGAIVNTGALPRDVTAWSELAGKSRTRTTGRMSIGSVDWLLSTAAAEEAAAMRAKNATLQAAWDATKRNASAEMLEWFTSRGGQLSFVRPVNDSTLADGSIAPELLEVLEDLDDGEVVLSMPLKLSLSLLSTRHTKSSRGSNIYTTLKPVFEKKEEWGLAMLVLSEYFKHKDETKPEPVDPWERHLSAKHRKKKKKKKKTNGGVEGSAWGPFLRNLRLRTPTSDLLHQMQGSYALTVMREWEEDAQELDKFLRKKHVCIGTGSDVCSREPSRLGSQNLAETDLRWALWVVRQHAIYVTKRSTREQFLAVVPYSHLLRHAPGAGGNITFEFDNTIRVAVGPHSAGDAVTVDLGPTPDAHVLLARHVVDESRDNPHNSIKLTLPAAPSDDNVDDLFWQLDTLREWRKAMRLPPRLSDLWRLTEQLHLFGDGEEEQKLLSAANYQRANLPLSSEQATAEEQLMLLNGMDDEGAQVALYGDDFFSSWTPVLYTSPDAEDDPLIESVMEDLADSVQQLSDSVVMSHADNSTQEVINATQNFLVHGVMPSRGLDRVDQTLLRKISLLRKCGPASDYLITVPKVSDALFCAVRVFLMNETDLNLVCPKAAGPWMKPECKGDAFNTSVPISRANEAAAIQALLASVRDLLSHYVTSVDDDESLLTFGGDMLPPGSAVRSVVVTRLREKRLLHHTIEALEARLAGLDDVSFATTAAVQAQREREEQEAAEAEWRAQVLEAAKRRQVVADVAVDVGMPDGGNDIQVHLVVHEGDFLDDVVARFAALHGVPASDVPILVSAAKAQAPSLEPMELAVPVVTPDGVRRALVVHHNEDLQLAIRKFCVVYNVTGDLKDALNTTAMARHAARLTRPVRVVMPVASPDGRRLQLLVREGDQHEVASTVADFVSAYHLPGGAVESLAVEVLNRLPPTVFTVPVTSPGQRRLLLRVLDGDEPNLVAVVRTFCEVWQLPDASVPQLVAAARRGLHPDAHVLPPAAMEQ